MLAGLTSLLCSDQPTLKASVKRWSVWLRLYCFGVFFIWCKILVIGWKRKKGMILKNRNDIFRRILFCRERWNLQACPWENTKPWRRQNICQGSLVEGPEQKIRWPVSLNSAPSHPFQQHPLHGYAPELLLSADPGLVISFCRSVFDTNANPPDLQFTVAIWFWKSSADIGEGKQKTEHEREMLSLCCWVLAIQRQVKILVSSCTILQIWVGIMEWLESEGTLKAI